MTEGPMKVVHLEPKKTQPAKIVYISEEKLKEETMEPTIVPETLYEEVISHYAGFDLITMYIPKGRLWNTEEEASNVVRGMMTTGDKLTATLLQVDMNVEHDFNESLPVRLPCVMLKFKKQV